MLLLLVLRSPATWLRMCQAVAAKDTAAALQEQAWKLNVSVSGWLSLRIALVTALHTHTHTPWKSL